MYHRALACLDAGDEVAARRAVEEGLARSWAPWCAQVRDCLDDLGAQLDGEAALRRFAGRTPGPRGWLARPHEFAHDVMTLGRAHLVEAVIEEVALLLSPAVLRALIARLACARTSASDDLLLAAAVVLHGRPARAARRASAGASPASSAVRALVQPRLAAAWTASCAHSSRRHQVVLAVARDGGRVAPLVALIDDARGGRVLRDAFFLPDMVPGRMDREVLAPMAAAGMRAAPVGPGDALDAVCAALHGTLQRGAPIPSEAHQSVVARMRRLQAACRRSPADVSA